MLRVALVLDDYNELIYLQTVLRKIGIDVEGLQNTKKYEELSLGFNPQVIIVSAFGKKVQGIDFVKNLHRPRGLPKVLLLSTAENPVSKEEAEASKADLVIESPISPKNLIHSLALITPIDEKVLIEKFEKLQASGALETAETIQLVGQDEEILVNSQGPKFTLKESLESSVQVENLAPENQGGTFLLKKEMELETLAQKPASQKKSPSERENRYKSFLTQIEPLKDAKATSYKRETIFQFNKKIRSAPAPADLPEIEADRKTFVKHLFTKKN